MKTMKTRMNQRMKRFRLAGVWIWCLAVLTIQSSQPSKAFCVEPSFSLPLPEAPGPYRKPVVPSCLKTYSKSGEHSCEKHEIAAYFDEVNGYIRRLNDYVTLAKSYASEAEAFAKDVTAFARCEAKEVKEQHK